MRLVLRIFFGLVISFSLPMVLGWQLGGAFGISLGGAISSFALFISVFSASDRILRFVRAGESSESQPLVRSFRRALELRKVKAVPQVVFYPSVYPEILVLRPLMKSDSGEGWILVSQGLLSYVTEDQLRALLVDAYDRWTRPGLWFKTLAVSSMLSVVSLIPRGWAQFLWVDGLIQGRDRQASGLNPMKFLATLFFLPCINLIRWFSTVDVRPAADLSTSERLHFDQALMRIQQARKMIVPGSRRLRVLELHLGIEFIEEELTGLLPLGQIR
jgi:hypothetical protein